MLIEITVHSNAPHNKITSASSYDVVTSKFREVLRSFGITLGGREIKPTEKLCDLSISFFIDLDDPSELTQLLRDVINDFMLEHVGSDAKVDFGTTAQDNNFTILLKSSQACDRMSCFVLEGDRSQFSPKKAQIFMGVVKAQYYDKFKRYPLQNMLGKSIGVYKVTYNDYDLITVLECIRDVSQIAKENFFNIIFSEVEKYDELL